MATPPAEPLPQRRLEDRALLTVVLGATLLFAAVLWPLSGGVSWAIFLAIVFSALQERIVLACKGRRGWAACVTMAVIILIVVLPTALLLLSVTHEAAAVYHRAKSGDIEFDQFFVRAFNFVPDWARGWLERNGVADLQGAQQRVVEALGESSHALTSRVFTLGRSTLELLINFFVMLYLLFFMLRDGPELVRDAERTMPLRPEDTKRLLGQFATVVRATVKGNVVVALVQGTLGSLAFWVVGLTAPLLWGAMLALLSLIPAIGHVLVWGPAALYLFSTGQVWSAVGLAVWCVFVIGLVDNFLRPILVGKETKLPNYLVLVATIGGLAVFGFNGFVIGPVVAAMFIAAWDIFSKAQRRGGG